MEICEEDGGGRMGDSQVWRCSDAEKRARRNAKVFEVEIWSNDSIG